MASQGSQAGVQGAADALEIINEEARVEHMDQGTIEGESETVEGQNVAAQGDNEGQRRGAKRSKAWNDFVQVKVKGDELANKCNHCGKCYKASNSGPTSQMIRHLKKCPGLSKAKGQQELSFVKDLNEEDQEVVSLINYKYDKEKVKRVVAKLVIMDERPFKSVESKLFNLLCKCLQPRHESFSRHTIRNEAMKLYKEEKEKLKNKLMKVESICLTSDAWTSRTSKHYMSLTAHYVDEDWKLQKRILNFRYFPPPHTGIEMSKMMKSFLLEWGIDGKVLTLTLDNASSNDAMVKILKEGMPTTSKFQVMGRVFHLRCCAHVLNLIVQVGLTHIKGVIENVRESVKYIKSSAARRKDFDSSLVQVNLSSKKGLCLDVSTRWNSTYLMLKAAKEVKQAFVHYAASDENYKWCPSQEDWMKYELIENLLEVFYKATEVFSGSKYPTANLFLPMLHKVKKKLDVTYVITQGHMKDMIEAMKLKFDKYWDECNLILGIACILDPRYKLAMVRFALDKVYGNEKVIGEIEKVRRAFNEIYDFYEDKLRAKREACRVSASSSQTSIENMAADCDNDDDDEFSKFMEEEQQFGVRKSDLDAYTEEPNYRVQPGGEPFDVFDYWKSVSITYPTLSIMARDILSIPLSTVASESAFSTGSRVVSDYRSSLASETIEALVCTQDWLRPFYDGKDFEDDDEVED